MYRVYLTGIIDRLGPITYARAGYIYVTVKDRIRGKSAISVLNGSLLAIRAITGRPEQGLTDTVKQG